jgi:hypothetical protein
MASPTDVAFAEGQPGAQANGPEPIATQARIRATPSSTSRAPRRPALGSTPSRIPRRSWPICRRPPRTSRWPRVTSAAVGATAGAWGPWGNSIFDHLQTPNDSQSLGNGRHQQGGEAADDGLLQGGEPVSGGRDLEARRRGRIRDARAVLRGVGPGRAEGRRHPGVPADPARSRYPVRVVVGAYQWGRPTEPKVETVGPVFREFFLERPSK